MIFGFYKHRPVRNVEQWKKILELYNPFKPDKNITLLTPELIRALNQTKDKKWKQHNPANSTEKIAFFLDEEPVLYPSPKKVGLCWMEADKEEVEKVRNLYNTQKSIAKEVKREIIYLEDDFTPVYVPRIITLNRPRYTVRH